MATMDGPAKAERWMPAGPGRARVRFDTDALAEDVARLSPPGQTALRHAHDRFERAATLSVTRNA